jgi:hypothetical protein
MPQVTFLVALNLDDLSDLPGVSAEISDDLDKSGFQVLSVAPWQRPSLTQGQPINVPQTQPTQNENPIT